jgi:acetyl esterase/lipase
MPSLHNSQGGIMLARIVLVWMMLSCASLHAGEIIPDVVYGHKDGMALIYDVFKPDNPNGAGIIYIISGGWFSNWSPPQAHVPWFANFTDAGYTVFAVYHGSAPRFKVPEAYADVSRAVRHIRLRAGDMGVDPARLGVAGGSAGGHLALMIGVDSDAGSRGDPDPVLQTSNRVAAVVSYYPIVDLRQAVGTAADRFPALDFPREQAPGISPILHVTEDDPPTLVIHGDADQVSMPLNSKVMHRLLSEKGVITDHLVINGGTHGFRNPEHRKRAEKARLEWFNKHLLE